MKVPVIRAFIAAAAPHDAAGRGRQEPVTQAHQDALAGPVWTQDHSPGSWRDLARHSVDDRSSAGDERNVLEDQRKHGGLPIAANRRGLDDLRRGVDDEHDGDEHDAEAERER